MLMFVIVTMALNRAPQEFAYLDLDADTMSLSLPSHLARTALTGIWERTLYAGPNGADLKDIIGPLHPMIVERIQHRTSHLLVFQCRCISTGILKRSEINVNLDSAC